tara:strand:- start:4403 stop:5461 length:1059 start_codon:yes stop_codon:yes gene_type:complete
MANLSDILPPSNLVTDSSTDTLTNKTLTSPKINEDVAVTATATELNLIDGSTAGTVVASKAVVVDSNKDIASFRNVTLTGELDAATLDISGNADIDGTTNLDAVDIDGAVQIDNTVTVGEDDTGYDVKFFGDTASAYMLWDTSADDLILGGAARVVVPQDGLVIGSTAVTSTAAELNILDGVTSTTAELNILDGVTSTATELNILDGVTATTAELNYLDLATLGSTAASKVVSADANNVVRFTGGIHEEAVTVTSSSNATTVNLRDGTNFLHTLTENTTFTFSNPPTEACIWTLKIVQDSSARTITWPGTVDWPSATAPTLTATNAGVDVFVFLTNDGGTIWYGFTAGQAMG